MELRHQYFQNLKFFFLTCEDGSADILLIEEDSELNEYQNLGDLTQIVEVPEVIGYLNKIYRYKKDDEDWWECSPMDPRRPLESSPLIPKTYRESVITLSAKLADGRVIKWEVDTQSLDKAWELPYTWWDHKIRKFWF